MELASLNVILVHPRFPENIGMTIRACANMGVNSLSLVCPERWKKERILALATPKGRSIYETIQFYDELECALADSHMAFATTARTGGWRKCPQTPDAAAKTAMSSLKAGERVSIVFGPEDRGLTNAQLTLCRNLVHIQTYGEATSLNLAQSVLLVLYEFARSMRSQSRHPSQKRITLGELTRLENELKFILHMLDCEQGKISDYYFLQWQSVLERAALKRHEFDMLMGFCRQIKNKVLKQA